MSFEVIRPGMMTLIQDTGRFGFQHLGVTTGGPMDEHAYVWANHLLGNPIDAPQLEITFGMLSLKAEAATTIAITGADLGARINDRPVAPWRTYAIKQGDEIEFEAPVQGLRAYLAVAGGFTLTPRLGSCSTVTREGLGGVDGNGMKLSQGQHLPFQTSVSTIDEKVPAWAVPDYSRPLELGVILGYQCSSFDIAELMKLFTSTYEVTQNIDRMGYRLAGEAVRARIDGIVSEGIAYGAIQIPSDGQPIVLLRDRQTIGGYPKVGCLSSLDAGQLAQRAPGAAVNFRPMDVAEAEAQRMIFNHTFGL